MIVRAEKPDIDKNITVMGSVHSPPTEEIEDINLEEVLDQDWEEALESEMEEHEVFAWESVGYGEEWEEGDLVSPDGGEFYRKVYELSTQNFDELLGPDSKEAGYYLACLGAIPLPFGISMIKGINDEREGNASFLEATRGYLDPEQGQENSMNRREMISLGLGIIPIYFLGVADPLFSDYEENMDKSSSLASTGLDDFREVFIAEGLVQASQEYENGVLGLFGDTHVNSIVNYVEAPEVRKKKIKKYESILPESSTKMSRYERSQDYWKLAEVIDIPEKVN